MAPRIICQADDWTIIQDPTDRNPNLVRFYRNPNLVRFYRSNGKRRLLDQIAEWDPHTSAWRCTRWAPKPPVVPQWLIDKVVAHMRFEERAF